MSENKKRKKSKNPTDFKVWRESLYLDMRKPEQVELALSIQDLRSRHRWSATARSAIAIFLELQEGKTDLLLEHFPFLRDRLGSQIQQDNRWSDLQYQLMKLEARLAEGAIAPLRSTQAAEPKQIVLNLDSSLPDDDDEDTIELTKSKVDGLQIGQNFVNSLEKLG